MAQTRGWLCVQLSGTQESCACSGPGLMALCAQSCRSLLKGTQFFLVLYRLEHKMRPPSPNCPSEKGVLTCSRAPSQFLYFVWDRFIQLRCCFYYLNELLKTGCWW